jgi:hypothetical protein
MVLAPLQYSQVEKCLERQSLDTATKDRRITRNLKVMERAGSA